MFTDEQIEAIVRQLTRYIDMPKTGLMMIARDILRANEAAITPSAEHVLQEDKITWQPLSLDFTDMLDRAKIHCAWQPLWGKLKGTPFENDVSVWMVEFANIYIKALQRAPAATDSAEQGDSFLKIVEQILADFKNHKLELPNAFSAIIDAATNERHKLNGH